MRIFAADKLIAYTMTEFLRTVVKHYLPQISDHPLAAHRWLFVFPNHRSGLFFKKYYDEEQAALHAGAGKPSPYTTPRVISIAEFFGQLSHWQVLDRTALLFRLYDIYRRMSTRLDKEEFDQFVFWGDMLLSDFDDVDKYMADARQVFHNVRDLKQIDQEFGELPPEAVAVIQQFWTNFRAEQQDDKRHTFSQTWNILFDLYSALRQQLMGEGVAYEGMMQRQVVEQLQAFPKHLDDDELRAALNDLPGGFPYDKVIFVGLTALSLTERHLIRWLQDRHLGECCWDYADPLTRPTSQLASPSYFSRRYLPEMPNALSPEELDEGRVPTEQRDIRLYNVASGVGQSDVVRRQLLQWQAEGIIDTQSSDSQQPANAFHTAVVLPDERQLLPVLYAMPPSLDTLNVTMGYGLRQTPITALVQNLALLQQQQRHYADAQRSSSFYYKVVMPVLSHNYVMAISGSEAQAIASRIKQENLYQVPVSLIDELGDTFLRRLFRPISTARETYEYLHDIFETLREVADAEHDLAQSVVFSTVDQEFLYHYAQLVERLGEEARNSGYEFTMQTFFMLLDKLAMGVSVPFSGEPLKGLQVMGVLETRAIDFENLIILSMNEGVFPGKTFTSTFIPMTLRRAFGLPTRQHRDAIYAYHFHRLLSRARRVVLVYDSRTDGLSSGEESRYVKQLRYLLGKPGLNPRAVTSDIAVPEVRPVVVRKTPRIMRQLASYLKDGPRRLSASALKTYIACPVNFYLEYVEGVREENTVTDGVDASQFGSVLHGALQYLYDRAKGQVVMADNLRHLMSRRDTDLRNAVVEAFHNELGIQWLEGYNQLVSEILVEYLHNVLQHDMRHCTPMTYLNSEQKIFMTHTTADGKLCVNVTAIFDRLDFIDGVLRVVDYKTSNSEDGAKRRIADLESMFRPNASGNSKDEAMQVMMYCMLLLEATDEELQQAGLQREHLRQVQPHLYHVRDMYKTRDAGFSLLTFEKKPVLNFADCYDSFRERFDQMLTEIFDPDVPFAQPQGTCKHCNYCSFNQICKK